MTSTPTPSAVRTLFFTWLELDSSAHVLVYHGLTYAFAPVSPHMGALRDGLSCWQ
jgi:hypothetical protein